MPDFFLIKGNHKVYDFVDFNGKAHFLSENKTLKIREHTHSNSFVYFSDGKYNLIEKIYDTEQIDYKAVFESLEVSEITDLSFFKTKLKEDELVEISKKYYLIRRENALCRISNENLTKLSSYIQTLENKADFNFINDQIRKFALESLTGQSDELGFFILLDCKEKGLLDEFVSLWRKKDLNDINLSSLINFLNQSYLEEKEKKGLIIYLENQNKKLNMF